jgi:hypothetical protein
MNNWLLVFGYISFVAYSYNKWKKPKKKLANTYLSRIMTMTSGVAKNEVVEVKKRRKRKMICSQCNHGQTNVD